MKKVVRYHGLKIILCLSLSSKTKYYARACAPGIHEKSVTFIFLIVIDNLTFQNIKSTISLDGISIKMLSPSPYWVAVRECLWPINFFASVKKNNFQRNLTREKSGSQFPRSHLMWHDHPRGCLGQKLKIHWRKMGRCDFIKYWCARVTAKILVEKKRI